MPSFLLLLFFLTLVQAHTQTSFAFRCHYNEPSFENLHDFDKIGTSDIKMKGQKNCVWQSTAWPGPDFFKDLFLLTTKAKMMCQTCLREGSVLMNATSVFQGV